MNHVMMMAQISSTLRRLMSRERRWEVGGVGMKNVVLWSHGVLKSMGETMKRGKRRRTSYSRPSGR
jgi:hypothetical protein